jgi:uncharacterized membrane protein (DUF2068 family)
MPTASLSNKPLTRSPALLAIVLYKGILAGLLLLTATALLLLLRHQQTLAAFSDAELPDQLGLIQWVLDKLLHLEPSTIGFSSLGIGLYGGVNAIEGVGLWYQKNWANWLVLVLTGLGLPAELLQLTTGFSGLKLTILAVNLAVFLYFLQHLRSHSRPSLEE